MIDFATVCDYNEMMIVDAVNKERAEAKAKRDSERAGRRSRR